MMTHQEQNGKLLRASAGTDTWNMVRITEFFGSMGTCFTSFPTVKPGAGSCISDSSYFFAECVCFKYLIHILGCYQKSYNLEKKKISLS